MADWQKSHYERFCDEIKSCYERAQKFLDDYKERVKINLNPEEYEKLTEALYLED